MELNNITILIIGLIAVSITSLILANELIATTVIGGLIGYLSKDVNVNLESNEDTKNNTGTVITYTKNDAGDDDDTA